MENQNFEKNRLVFLDQFNNLYQKNRFPDALALAQERLKVLPMDADAYVAVGEAQIAMAHLEESQQMLCELENRISALTYVFARMGELYAKKGYAKEAQLCYQQYLTFNPSAETSLGLTSQRTPFEELQKKENKINQEDDVPASDHLINTLSGWLTNIHRIKTHAANNQ